MTELTAGQEHQPGRPGREGRYEGHPTVRAVRARRSHRADTAARTEGAADAEAADGARGVKPVDAAWLRQIVLDAGADDVGFVSIDHPDLAHERRYIDEVLPGISTLIGFVVRTNRDNVRSPARATANHEFHKGYDVADAIARKVTRALNDRGVRAANPAAGFPQEMSRFPDHAHSVPHKLVAVAAGLGQMGIHRNVIHPKFGNFILLGTVVMQAPVTEHGKEIDFNPCLECKLCVAACPVGAIGHDGSFDFMTCYTHNYREFMTGFSDWVHAVVDSEDAQDYDQRFDLNETVSMWQSLAFKPDYKAAYCVAVCPAGEEVIEPWLDDRRGFTRDIVRPLQHKEETVYVTKGSPAGDHARRRFPHKRVKEI